MIAMRFRGARYGGPARLAQTWLSFLTSDIHGGGLGSGFLFRILSARGVTGWLRGARTSSAITEVALGWNAWLTNMMTRMDCGLQ